MTESTRASPPTTAPEAKPSAAATTAGSAGPTRRPCVAVLGSAWAIDEIEARLRAEGGRVLAIPHADAEDVTRGGETPPRTPPAAGAEGRSEPGGFEAVIVHVPRGGDLIATVREHAALVRAPIVAACEHLTPGLLYEALEAGASDCIALADRHGIPRIASLGDDAGHGRLARALALDEPSLDGMPGPLTYAVFRAAAGAARLAGERRRTQDLALALARARAECEDVRAVSITDVVTGLFNKRHFFERLDEEENKAWRTGHAIALVLVDLDHFKSVNDTFGHDAGDRVLKGVAQVIRHCTRNYDIACRFGGEEFAIILPATRADRAHHVAERLRTDLRMHVFDDVSPSLRVTASCGVADLPGPRITTKDDLVRAADRALYRAKAAGRDRTFFAEEVELLAGGGASGAAATLSGGPASSGPREATGRISIHGLSGHESAALGSLSRDVLDRVERLRAAIKGLSEELTRTYERAVQTLVRLVEDGGGPRAFGSAETVARYAERIAGAMELGTDQIERIRRAGLLQELGMVPLAGRFVHEGSLDAGEQELVRQHPALSVRIADELGYLRDELPIILHHHENFDGSGYPRGLRGERIPLGSRILAVAMAYEAMTSDRPYRRPLPASEAIAEIARLAGTRYDPTVVKGFQAAFRESA